MTVGEALRAGWTGLGRVRRWIVLAWLASVLVALPLAAVVYGELGHALGSSTTAETMRTGFDDLWHRGFSARAHGLASTFGPGVTGIGAVLGPLDVLARGDLFALPPALVAAGAAYWLVWVFLAGGFVARLCDRGRGGGFFADAARCFPRVLVLASTSALACVLLLRGALDLGGDIVERATIDEVDERVAFAWTLGKYAVAWAVVAMVGAVFEQARVAAVAEPSRSLVQAVRLGLVVVARAPARMLALVGALFAGSVALVAAYAVIAPGAGQAGWAGIVFAFALSQVYVVARIAMRVLGLAAHTAWQREAITFPPGR